MQEEKDELSPKRRKVVADPWKGVVYAAEKYEKQAGAPGAARGIGGNVPGVDDDDDVADSGAGPNNSSAHAQSPANNKKAKNRERVGSGVDILKKVQDTMTGANEFDVRAER